MLRAPQHHVPAKCFAELDYELTAGKKSIEKGKLDATWVHFEHANSEPKGQKRKKETAF